MTFVRTISNQFPPRRFDDTVFTIAHIQESPATGTPNFSTIATVTLSPAYADALDPPAYNFTTNTAALDPGLYRIVWEDASGAQEIGEDVIRSDQESFGTVADEVRSLMPYTWKQLAAVDWYGTSMLMTRIKAAKYKIFPDAIAQADESTYTMLMVQYAAKVAALEIIPAGIEYWMNQTISKSATGTNENVNYGDRAQKLRQLAEALQQEIAALAANPNLVGVLNPIIEADLPDVDTLGDGTFITEDPYDMLPAFTSVTAGA